MGPESKTLAKRAAIGAVGLGLFTYATCVEYLKPNEIGIMQVTNPFGQQGFVNSKYEGKHYYSVLPVVNKLHRFPGTLQALRFGEGTTEHDADYIDTLPALIVSTLDQFKVKMHATVLYRIVDPFKLVNKAGPGDNYKAAVINQNIPGNLANVLGQSQPEDFFEVDETTGKVKRIEAQERSKVHLNRVLAQYGVEIDRVMILGTEYDPKVQDRLEMKSENDQRTRTRTPQAVLEGKKAELGKIKQQGIQAAEVRKKEGVAYFDEKRGEWGAYDQSKRSEGDKLFQMAQAEATRLENEAYQGPGAELLVGLKMAENLKGLDQIVWPVCGTRGNVLDMDQTLKMITGQK